MRILIAVVFYVAGIVSASIAQERESFNAVDDLQKIENYFAELRRQYGGAFSPEIAARSVAAYSQSSMAYHFNLSAVRKAAFCVDETLAWLYQTKDRHPGLPMHSNSELIELSNKNLADALEALRSAPVAQTETSSRLVAAIMFYVNSYEPYEGFLDEFAANREAIYQLYYDGAGEIAAKIDRTGCFFEIDSLGEHYVAYDRELRGFYSTIADWLPAWQ